MEIYVKRFLELLMLENEKHNLVSRKSTPADLEQHVKDSLQIMQWVSLSNQRVVDIGSGAGFPGMILAMA
ncbi:MAG: 16S rRNA (guanine(527)-N(7))-methyltransferase RsmG, partial [Syntrophomonadaceae bacterium]|nr:16S rRNA (guanine(527)-N(7))-methyltransferase RsmG [Syntrophomonadaceae bacterium]